MWWNRVTFLKQCHLGDWITDERVNVSPRDCFSREWNTFWRNWINERCLVSDMRTRILINLCMYPLLLKTFFTLVSFMTATNTKRVWLIGKGIAVPPQGRNRSLIFRCFIILTSHPIRRGVFICVPNETSRPNRHLWYIKSRFFKPQYSPRPSSSSFN